MSSWNPFTRNTTSRKSIGLITTRDFDREIRRLESLEENGKSLTRDLIKQEKSLDDFTRGQLKLLHDLSGSSFINHYDQQQTSSNISQLINDWKQTAQHISEQTNLLNEITTKTIIDSSKRLTLALANVTNAIKKREQSLNDYIKIQAKLDKLNEKLNSSTNSLSTTTQANNSTTINNNNKIEQIQKQLNEAKQQYEIKNQILTNELPILHEQRAAFVYPCLEAFIEAQAHYCDQLEAAYRSLIGQMDVNTDNSSTLDEINAKLANIKSLSIVASE